MKKPRTLADRQIGEKATIAELHNDEVSLRLMEMGCVPGCEVELKCKALLGGPVCVNVSGYHLSLRLVEAAKILLV